MTEDESIAEFNRVLRRYTRAAIDASTKGAVVLGSPSCDEHLRNLLWYNVSRAIHAAMFRGYNRGDRWFGEGRA